MQTLSEHIKTKAHALGIALPPPLPIFRAPPNPAHLNDWAESQMTPITRKIAYKAIENLNYIDFEHFLNQLQHTINDFHQRLGTQPYALILGLLPHQRQDPCSDKWVIGLALAHCGLQEPTAIITPDELVSFRRMHPQVTDLLILDDAAYSGTQKKAIIDFIQGTHINSIPVAVKTNDLSIYIGFPFITQGAKQGLACKQHGFKQMIFLEHVHMPTMVDILDAHEIFYAKSANMAYIDSRHTLTYFDHRFADFMSSYQPIYNGTNLLEDQITSIMRFHGYTHDAADAKKNKHRQLITDPAHYNHLVCSSIAPNDALDCSGYTIPTIVPPYKMSHYQSIAQLTDAIDFGTLGERTPFPVIDPHVTALLAQPVAAKPSFFQYKKPNWPIEKQLSYDKAIMARNQDDITHHELIDIEGKQQQLHEQIKHRFSN